VGLVIGHAQDSLEDLLEASRTAESRAKEDAAPGRDRNAIVVEYRSRGGAAISVRRRWDDIPTPLDDFNNWTNLFREEQLPGKAAYDLRELALVYQGWPSKTEDDKTLLATAMQADAGRLLSRKKEARPLVEPRVQRVETPENLIDLANTIIISKQFAMAKDMAEGK